MSELAVNGGSKVRLTPIQSWPVFESDEIDAVVDVLRSGKVNYWTGDLTKKFEQEFAHYHGMKHGIALANGTLALELALIGLGIGPGDDVITTCRTFIASASCIVRVGATPVLADVDSSSQNITLATIKKVLTPNTKALVMVHLGGWPCDMHEIMQFAEEQGIKVIEDCAQAHGARIDGRLVGSFGHMSAFSFCQDKIMTTGGEGGMLLTNDTLIFEKMWAFKDHGKSYDAVYRREHPPGFRWLHETFGTNWRLTEIQSVIGLIQLGKLQAWVEKRRVVADKIVKGLGSCPGLRIPEAPIRVFHSYYRLYVFLQSSKLNDGWDRNRVMHAIQAEGLPCFVGSCGEIYLEKAFQLLNAGPRQSLETAKDLAESSLAFLVHPTLDEQYVYDLIQAVSKVMAFAARE